MRKTAKIKIYKVSNIFDLFLDFIEPELPDLQSYCEGINSAMAKYINENYFLQTADGRKCSAESDGEKVWLVCQGKVLYKDDYREVCGEYIEDAFMSFLENWLDGNGYFTEEWAQKAREYKSRGSEAVTIDEDVIRRIVDGWESYFDGVINDYVYEFLDSAGVFVTGD